VLHVTDHTVTPAIVDRSRVLNALCASGTEHIVQTGGGGVNTGEEPCGAAVSVVVTSGTAGRERLIQVAITVLVHAIAVVSRHADPKIHVTALVHEAVVV